MIIKLSVMDLWTRKNIQNYTGDPDESSDINYSKKQQEIRRAIRVEDEKTKKEGGNIDWNYMLNDLM